MLNFLFYNYHMHNLYAIFAKFLDICKQLTGNLVNKHRPEVIPKFSEL